MEVRRHGEAQHGGLNSNPTTNTRTQQLKINTGFNENRQIFTRDNNSDIIIIVTYIKPKVKVPLHTDLNTDKGKQNKRKSFLYSGT